MIGSLLDYTFIKIIIIEEGESILLHYGPCYNAFPRPVTFVMTNVWFHCLQFCTVTPCVLYCIRASVDALCI